MTLKTVRALFESHLNAAYQALTPPVPVMFDNVQETPPNSEHVILSLGYDTFTEPLVCMTEPMIEAIRGTIQIACYTPKGRGMARLEELGVTAIQALNTIHTNPLAVQAHPQIPTVNGPVPILSGDQPYALVNVSAPFRVRIPMAAPLPPIGAVQSVFGRTGVVVAKEADYLIDQMGDVDTTTTPPAGKNLLEWDGTNWVPSETVDSGTYVGP